MTFSSHSNSDVSPSTYQQHTLRDSFTCIGPGLHSGLQVVMTIMPAEENSGITFYRRDVDHRRATVAARWNSVTDTRLSTTIANSSGICVSTVEHLLSAFYACGVDNARVVLDAPEVPIMDGSAAPFVTLIEKTGLRTQNAARHAIVITQSVEVSDGDKVARLEPSSEPWVDLTIDFEQAAIGRQRFSAAINSKEFRENIAGARTFGFKDQLTTMQKLGLARGGSLNNAVLIDNDKVINREGLRCEDEFVRHKVIDVIGDMALIGAPIIGRYQGLRSGHKLNNQLLQKLINHEHCWIYTELKQALENYQDLFSSHNRKIV